jgi:predicted  nucleic acid-binding Zn-ribbon protein
VYAFKSIIANRYMKSLPWQAIQAQKTREHLKSKLQAALQEEVALVERMQGLESDKAELEERAARMEERLAYCQQELAAARGGDAEAAALAEKLGESADKIRELEEKVAQVQRESEGLCTERAGLRARAAQLEQEVRLGEVLMLDVSPDLAQGSD